MPDIDKAVKQLRELLERVGGHYHACSARRDSSDIVCQCRGVFDETGIVAYEANSEATNDPSVAWGQVPDRERAIIRDRMDLLALALNTLPALLSAAEDNARLREAIDRNERTMDELCAERDRAQDAIQDIHIALGGDGEWVFRTPSQPPPYSGDLHLDTLELAKRVVVERSAATNRERVLREALENVASSQTDEVEGMQGKRTRACSVDRISGEGIEIPVRERCTDLSGILERRHRSHAPRPRPRPRRAAGGVAGGVEVRSCFIYAKRL